MLAYIKGSLEHILEDSIVLENQGMGYDIRVAAATLNRLPPMHSPVMMYTYLHVREDELSLYGFLTKDELTVFKLLISVSGVGPKAGLSILSALSTDDLRMAVLSEDSKAIAKAQGVGPKVAGRIIMELKDKLNLQGFWDKEEDDSAVYEEHSGARQEAVSALIALGYSQMEAAKAVRAVAPDIADTQALLKEALKNI